MKLVALNRKRRPAILCHILRYTVAGDGPGDHGLD